MIVGTIMFATVAVLSTVGLGADIATNNGTVSWAQVVNTALLIGLTYIAHRNGGKADTSVDIARDVKAAVEDARAFAQSAEQCSQAAARIAKEVGGALRSAQATGAPPIMVTPSIPPATPEGASTGTSEGGGQA